MNLLRPDWQDIPSTIGALSSMRTGGISLAPYDDGAGGGGLNLGTHVGDSPMAVHENRARLRTLLPAEPAWLNQVHGVTVVDAAKAVGTPAADASFTTEPGVVCVIQTADCLPVLLCDLAGQVVGAAHAGWRGLAGGILDNTIAAMRAAGAQDIAAWMGPAIGPACFEVGEEVRQAFISGSALAAQAFVPVAATPGKYKADIYQLAAQALRRVGVERISGGAYCTVAEPSRFFSYRRDKITGRMCSMIWINPE